MQNIKSYLLCLFTLATIEIQANTVIVDNTYPTAGNYQTIQAAVTAASSGDIIQLRSGQTFTGPDNKNIPVNINLTFDTTDPYGTYPTIDLQNSGRFILGASGTSVTIQHLGINNGLANPVGGAILSYGNVTISNCNFNANVATYDGGAICVSAATSFNILACNFTGNNVQNGNGGAIVLYHDSNCSIGNCTFNGNYAPNGIGGGAIYNYCATLKTYYNSFMNNTVGSTGWGKAVCNYGGVACLDFNWWNSNINPSQQTNLIYNYLGTMTYSDWLSQERVQITN
jgi:hypothetical protein